METNRGVSLVIPGDPIAKKRIRCGCIHGHGHAYDDQKKEMDGMRKTILHVWNQMFDSPSEEIRLRTSETAQGSTFIVDLYFYLPVARSLNVGKKNHKFWAITPCVDKPDFDNLAKFYTDCCTGIIWPDDKQITKCTSWKVRFSENPRTEMEIMSKKELTLDEKTSQVFKMFSPKELALFCLEAGKMYWFYENNKEFFEDSRDLPPESFFSEASLRVSEFAQSYSDKLKKVARL